MKKIRLIILSVVLVLMGSVNLWATDYLFGFTTGNNVKYYLGIPSNPGNSGNCEPIIILGEDSDAYKRCIWHCVKGSTSGTASSIDESDKYYLYIEIGGTKYWLRDSPARLKPLRYTTSVDEAYFFKFNNTGFRDGNAYWYVYYNADDNTICSTDDSKVYQGKVLTIGSFARVTASPTGCGKVFVRGDTRHPDYVGGEDAFIDSDTDQEAKTGGKVGTKYYLYAKPTSGYYFKGWSKTNSYSVDITATNKSGSNENELAYNETNGYYALYYAMYVPYWKFSASGDATSAGHGIVSVNLTKSEVVATDNSSTTGTTTATFTATPESGYDFAGWTDSPSGTTVTQDTENPKTVTITNTTPGSTATVTLYAIFKPYTYSIVISAAGSSNGEGAVFTVSGPQNYKISVPIGGTKTIKDVPLGNYTVTPETTWSWNSTFSPASVSISFTSSSGSQSKPANFTITSKGSTKKHDEVYNIEIP